MRFRYFWNGIILENPVLILMIGLCPTLATSISARDALGMGIAASFVLIFSNIFVSAIRKIVPENIRIPVFIIIISTFVTIVDYILQAYQPDMYKVLGVFVPLIVVNCIILGRAEAFAYHHGIFDSFLDGLGKSIGFTLVIFIMGAIREILAQGTFFGVKIMPEAFINNSLLFMIFPPGGFLLIGILKAIVNKLFLNR
ncbi:MAG: RnfABCDGE type electron transport complex subunit E [candidate division WOR-3 bacterium]|nr:RnfABCDGE type electron transport complex subunit E [candidate division WOR-3 bacterium]MCX7836883.1 RnfABCDGE type electron transport complex subunit E [candidate division WOR-3 bacterium]MDW8114428.1 RnfABCDGE type electron transport complex subunit E [candidate division WOR-3 bacterium]